MTTPANDGGTFQWAMSQVAEARFAWRDDWAHEDRIYTDGLRVIWSGHMGAAYLIRHDDLMATDWRSSSSSTPAAEGEVQDANPTEIDTEQEARYRGRDHVRGNVDGKLAGYRGLGKEKCALTRCPKCGRENYAMAVPGGICCWCGYDINREQDDA